MDIDKFIEKLADQFDDTEPELFTPDLLFHDLEEWSSLSALSIIAFVRTEYGKKITALDIRDCQTVRDLFEMVESK
jgi:acyl carrier protein